jgi:hypothetical protein
MQVFSAPQALSPAINRTKSLLFQPFQWGTFLKLCAIAVFTEGIGGENFNFSHRGFEGHSHIHKAFAFPAMPAFLHLNPAWIVALVVIVLAAFLLALVIYYLAVRLRFALFSCLVHQSTLIAPGWHKYRFQAMRFFWLSIIVGIVFFALVVAVLSPFALGFWHIYQQTQLGAPFSLRAFLTLLLPLIPVMFVVTLTASCFRIILCDLMLPHIAIENASAGQAWLAVRRHIAAEFGSFLLYGLLRVVVPIVAAIGLAIILFIPCLIVFGLLAIMIAAVHGAFSDAALPIVYLGWVLQGVLGFLVVGLGFLVAVSFFGPIAIAIRNYALLFYGGRYQALGNILFPPPASPQATQPGLA